MAALATPAAEPRPAAVRAGSLPARVLAYLNACGASWAGEVADALEVRDAHVTQALRTLVDRGLVEPADRDGRRQLYDLADRSPSTASSPPAVAIEDEPWAALPQQPRRTRCPMCDVAVLVALLPTADGAVDELIAVRELTIIDLADDEQVFAVDAAGYVHRIRASERRLSDALHPAHRCAPVPEAPRAA